jgi:hypothetical protein
MLGSARTAFSARAWAPTGGDPYWSSVVMLLTARNNVVEDLSNEAAGITVVQSPGGVPEDDETKYNAYSIYNASETRFEVNADTDRNCSGVFTYEFWILGNGTTPPNNFSAPHGPSSDQGANQVIFVNGNINSGTPRFEFGTGFTSYNVHGSTMWDEAWHHIAMVRNTDNVIRFYYDGVESAATRTSTDTINFGTAAWMVGGFYNGDVANQWNGWHDDIRLTKGVARYTGNFTPPTEAFPIG